MVAKSQQRSIYSRTYMSFPHMILSVTVLPYADRALKIELSFHWQK